MIKTGVSLFAGIGGFDLAMERAGINVVATVECERLQGFPDQWTEGQADSHRYKQLGNAVAVPVVQWIIERFIQATN
jgi:DNA (cytosine-5)-methyltransferase 1